MTVDRTRSLAAPALPAGPMARKEDTQTPWQASFLLSKPQGNREPISYSQIPHIYVLLTVEISPITRDQSQIILQVIVQTDIEPFVLNPRQPVSASVQRTRLLNPSDELHLLNRRERTGAIEFVSRFQPITAAEIAVVKLSLHVARSFLGLPRNVHGA